MIDSVRSTVLHVLNKDNRGFLSPDEFNKFANLAQLEIFEEYFYELSHNKNKLYNRLHNSEHADIPKRLDEIIDSFALTKPLLYNAITEKHEPPGVGTNVNEPPVYKVNEVYNTNNDIVNKVTQTQVISLQKSSIIRPSSTNQVYVEDKDGYKIYPATTSSSYLVDYIRYPFAPKWTYTMVGSTPMFDSTKADYQDFEIPGYEFQKLVVRILKYAGVSIREQDVVAVAFNEENIDKQQKL